MENPSLSTTKATYSIRPNWSLEIAKHSANGEQMEICADRWTVVNSVRGYYEQNQSVPEACRVLMVLAEQLGKDKATRKFLYSCFPTATTSRPAR